MPIDQAESLRQRIAQAMQEPTMLNGLLDPAAKRSVFKASDGDQSVELDVNLEQYEESVVLFKHKGVEVARSYPVKKTSEFEKVACSQHGDPLVYLDLMQRVILEAVSTSLVAKSVANLFARW